MALSGKIKGKVTLNSGVYAYYMAYSGVQSVEGNYTDLTVKHYWTRSSTSLNFDTTVERRYGVTIDGTTSSGTKHFDFSPWPSDTTISTYTKRVYHNSDGTKSIKISTYANGRAASYGPSSSSETSGDCTASATITLDTIPRASSVTCNSFFIGDSTTINIDRASTNFTHTIKYVYGYLSGVIADKTTLTSIGWTAPVESFYTQIPNGRTGYGSIVCETYSGNTLIGTKTTNFNAYAKDSDCYPTVSGTIVDTNEDTIALTGDSSILIKYLSKPKVTVSATPKYSSAIRARKILWGDGQLSTNAEETFSNGVTNKNVTVSATDSREYTTAVSYDLSTSGKWVEYVKLAFSRITLSRQESTLSTAVVKVSGNYFNGSFGSEANDFTLKYRYKPNESGSTFTNFVTIQGKDIPRTNDTFDYSVTLQNIDYRKEYIFEFVLEDKAMVVLSGEKKLESGQAIFRIGKDYVRINGNIKDKNGTDVRNGLSFYEYAGGTDPDTTIEELVLTAVNIPKAAGFYYVKTMFYSTKTAESNRTQVAYPYNNQGGTFYRYYLNGTGWSEWLSGDIVSFTQSEGAGVIHFTSGLLIQWGRVNITPTAANTVTSVKVNFPKTYDFIPNVVALPNTSVPQVIASGVGGGTTVEEGKTSMMIYMTRTNTVSTTYQWTAIGYKGVV